jgi:ubiquinone/menaquinone biosynthesis C-methylase UbiE
MPAAGHDWALPLYDPFIKLLGGESARQALLEHARLRPKDRVLDIGCGTGTAIVTIKRLHPSVEVVGLDPDPKALARARRKAARAGVSVQLDQGFSDALPYPDASFDRVLSSFMFHHIRAEEKPHTLREVRRVLTPEGSFHLLDLAGSESGAHGFVGRRLHSDDLLRDNAEDRVLMLMREAGFRDPKMAARGTIFFGHIAYCCYDAAV